jgi:hypothetical protein
MIQEVLLGSERSMAELDAPVIPENPIRGGFAP